MRTVRGIAAGAVALALAGLSLAACGGNNDSNNGGGTAPGGTPTGSAPAPANFKIGVAYDIGGRGDQSFNDSAARGLDKAKADYGVEVRELEASPGETEAAKEDRLRQLADADFNPIVAIGFAYAGPLKKVATDFPEVRFAIVDDASFTAPNVASLTFAENEGSYLVGVAAALKNKTGTIGFIGGVNTPLIQKFQAGYEAGAKAAKPGIKIVTRYLTQPPDFTGFQDPAKGQTAGQGLYDQGADIVFAAAGSSGNGVFKAAKASNKLGIGVDSDQFNQPALADVKDVIISSMVKKVDVAMYDFITSIKDNTFKSGQKVYDLKADGVDYATSGGKLDDIKTQLDDYKQKIIAGTIQVPSTM